MDVFEFVDSYNTDWLNVGDGHEIYYEVSGNPKGIPVVRLHGGPGDCSNPKNKQMYDPAQYCIVLFDQRGCGKSKPYGKIENNTTHDLIADMEKLRQHLGFERWVVTGGSWGSTLALLYAQAHSSRVLALSVNSIFLAEKSAVDWMYGENGAARVFPKEYEALKKAAGVKSVFDYVHDGVFNAPSERAAKDVSVQFFNYVGKLCSMEENQLVEQGARTLAEAEMSAQELQEAQDGFENFALNHTRIELMYEKNNFYIDEGQILRDMPKVAHIPLFITHGRYDVLCPASSAYALKNVHPTATLTVVPTAGHSGSESREILLDVYNNKIINYLVK